MRALLAGLAAAALIAAQTGCTTAPATGETVFTGGLSGDKAKRIGARQHPRILEQFGGPYDQAPDLQAYVTRVGNDLAAVSEEPDKDWTFTVLDSPIVNAFALPGGYVYITRGLLAITANEAQLAGVLGHEIGHVTARHAAARYGGNVLAQTAGVAAGIFLGRAGAQAANVVGAVALSAYSREQEFEADKLGVRYAVRAGYAPDGMAGLLERMQAKSDLEAELRGRDPDEGFNLLSTHPRTPKRVREAVAAADAKTPETPRVNRSAFLNAIDGMLYGYGPKQGFTRGRDFLHPELKFAFTVPEGFRIFNSAQRVVAKGPAESLIIFDAAGSKASSNPMDHLRNQWTSGRRLTNVERITINGMPAATGRTQVRTNAGPRDARLVVIRYAATRLYRFVFLTPPARTAEMNEPFRRTTYSFRRLSAEEAAALEPKRLTIHTVAAGETQTGLAERMRVEDLPLEHFRVLNGLTAGDTLEPGRRVKLVTQ